MTGRAVTPVDVRACRYGDPDVARMIEEIQAEYVVRYGGPDATPVTPADFEPPDGLFLLLYLDDGPVASGAWRRHDATSAEVKRMYVAPAHRNAGLARVMLAELERRATEMGYARLVLETGGRQPEAVALYESSGYHRIEPFGHYRDSPLNRCYGKDL